MSVQVNSFGQIHTGLQGGMAMGAGTQPRTVTKSDALKGNVCHWLVRISFHLQKRFQGGHFHFCGFHVLAFARDVIDFSVIGKPFAGRIQERFGTRQIESGIMFALTPIFASWDNLSASIIPPRTLTVSFNCFLILSPISPPYFIPSSCVARVCSLFLESL